MTDKENPIEEFLNESSDTDAVDGIAMITLWVYIFLPFGLILTLGGISAIVGGSSVGRDLIWGIPMLLIGSAILFAAFAHTKEMIRRHKERHEN